MMTDIDAIENRIVNLEMENERRFAENAKIVGVVGDIVKLLQEKSDGCREDYYPPDEGFTIHDAIPIRNSLIHELLYWIDYDEHRTSRNVFETENDAKILRGKLQSLLIRC